MKNILKIMKTKAGMTLVELLVALSLLMLIIVSFTPMLLSSYEHLYKAGETNVKTYDAKSSLENGLASRFSENIQEFNVRLSNLSGNISVNGRKIVASTRNTLETLFFGAKARLIILTPSRIPDDSSTHTVLIKTSNILWNNENDIIVDGTVPESAAEFLYKQDGKEYSKVYINTYLPIGTGNTDSTQFKQKTGTLTKNNADPEKKLIEFTMTGVDLTLSPVKVQATFVDEKNKIQTADAYIYIEVPTIIAAGGTAHNDYYTSSGVADSRNGTYFFGDTEETDAETGEVIKPLTYVFNVEGRKMNLDTTKASKTSGSVIQTVEYINEETDNANGLKPYYVIAGTKGAIYRIYSYKSKSGYNMEFAKKLMGASNASAITSKEPFVIEETGETIFPQIWSGDYTHYFGYSTYGKEKQTRDYAASYKVGSKSAWYTQSSTSGKGNMSFGSNARYCMDFDGLGLLDSSDYRRLKLRKASYIIIDFDNDYLMRTRMHKNWWNGNPEYTEAIKASALRMENSISNSLKDSSFFADWEKRTSMLNKNTKSTQNKAMSYTSSDLKTTEYSFISVSQATNGSAAGLLVDGQDTSQDTNGINNDNAKNSVEITSVYYDTTNGIVGYLGRVNAFASVFQMDNISKTNFRKDRGTKFVIWSDGDEYTDAYAADAPKDGYPTTYLVKSSDDGTGTFIYKSSSSDGNIDATYQRLQGYRTVSNEANSIGTSVKSNTDAAHSFFVVRDTSNIKKIALTDLKFTFGYSSIWENVFGKILYDGTNENCRSYETEYYESFYSDSEWNGTFPSSDEADTANPASLATAVPHSTKGDINQFNLPTNDYYNVWFMGEMFNLTHAATKDGITAAVGYSVSGSSYQFVNPADYTSLSTALGSIYNDGVLAVKLNNETSLDTKLYYKEVSGFDSTYITSNYNNNVYYKSSSSKGKDLNGANIDYGSNSGNRPNIDRVEDNLCLAAGNKAGKKGEVQFQTYGTHARNSIQFTSVDILALYKETSELDESGNVTSADVANYYYAYYGDNTGRVWRSLIAEVAGSGEELKAVDNIKYNNATANSLGEDVSKTGSGKLNGVMQEVKVNGNSFNSYFSNIETITIGSDGTIVITGTPADGSSSNYIYIGSASWDNENNTIKVENEKVVPLFSNTENIDNITYSASQCKARDCIMLGDFIYVVGTTGGSEYKGFIMAMRIADVQNTVVNKMVKFTKDELYSISGRIVT